MAADGSTFYVPRDRALVKHVDRFWRVIRQNACLGQGGAKTRVLAQGGAFWGSER